MRWPNRTAYLVLVSGLLAGCGVPAEGPPVTITRVPYDLTQPQPSEPATPAPTGTARPYVYPVRDNGLVPVKASATDPSDPARAVSEVLAQLAEGPSEADRSAGLSTALGLGTGFRLGGLDDSVARVDIAAGEQVPSPSRVPLAVAQVVLSVTSVPGVDSVLISRDGAPVELPLPGGALTAAPVTARDYAELVATPTVSGSTAPGGTATPGGTSVSGRTATPTG